ncbi:MAG: leucine-rich repeat domain-containing protein [Lachnospiraceae bacterium]|nr:leucine-rich repeat domain-containing protein [Lachnospiraceae bacterium]
MKKIIAFLMSIVLIAGCLPTQKTTADDDIYYSDLFAYGLYDNGDAIILYPRGDVEIGSVLEIPSFIEGHKVVRYNDIYSNDIVEVIIPGTVIEANRICSSNLEKVVIGEGVREIHDYAFQYSYKLTSVKLPESLEKIGRYAFYADRSITDIEIKQGVRRIEYAAFQYCSSLKSIDIPEACTYIGAGAFEYCDNLESVRLPDIVTTDAQAFANNPKMANVEFYHSNAPREGEEAPKIGNDTFLNAISLESIIIPEGYDTLMLNAFYNCSNLKEISLPESLSAIMVQALLKCDALESLTIRSNLTISNGPIFGGTNTSVKELYYTATERVPSSNMVGMYALEKVRFSDKLRVIEEGAFAYCSNLKDVVFPDSLKTLEAGAFADCTSLESINITKNVDNIDSLAFAGCTSLKKINVDPENETYLSTGKAIYTKDMKKLVLYNDYTDAGKVYSIPCGVEEIGEAVFNYNAFLEKIIIPKSVTKMDECEMRDTVVIYGYKDSAAEEYANKNGNPFVEISDENEINESEFVSIEGFQINPYNYGIRTRYSYPAIIDGQKVVSRGLVYGLKDYCTEADMTVNSECSDVYSYVATDKGNVANMFIDNADGGDEITYDTYVMTMVNNKPFVNSMAYMSDIRVRAYVQLENGTYIYGHCNEYSFYALADKLYRYSQMPNAEMHNILFDNILSVLKQGYSKVIYGEK